MLQVDGSFKMIVRYNWQNARLVWLILDVAVHFDEPNLSKVIGLEQQWKQIDEDKKTTIKIDEDGGGMIILDC